MIAKDFASKARKLNGGTKGCLASGKSISMEDCATLKEEKANFDLDVSALAAREEAVMKREAIIDKKDRELLILQEKFLIKIQKTWSLMLKWNRRKSFEDEIEMTRKAYDLREAELKQQRKACHGSGKFFSIGRQTISEKQQDVLEAQAFGSERKVFATYGKTVESKMRDISRRGGN
ncbi:hypothetical protein HPP92_028665 [Vanilla planifolia]|uniref:Uncharacterized protein n=1 Tax=Vanilla planifolia TaxID=51239 RepID=A0A835P4X7_VANPL|nr:hypothetical protein HPP92_028665 [Vanilla planifolia]